MPNGACISKKRKNYSPLNTYNISSSSKVVIVFKKLYNCQPLLWFPESPIPQGFVLGAVLFILYVAHQAALIEKHGLSPHQYADDTRTSRSCSPSHVDDSSSKVRGCVNDVAGWMRSNRLQLNPEKAELL